MSTLSSIILLISVALIGNWIGYEKGYHDGEETGKTIAKTIAKWDTEELK